MVTKKTPVAAPKGKRPTAAQKPKRELSLWERLALLGEAIPAEELDRLPTDGAQHIHHYLHGAPKRDDD